MPPRVAPLLPPPLAPLSRPRVFMRRVLIMPSKSHTNWLGKLPQSCSVAGCKLQVVVAVVVVGRQLLPRNALQVALYHEINNEKQKQQRDEKLGRAGQGWAGHWPWLGL